MELREASKAQTGGRGGQAPILGHERMEVQARKFYSQRNMYLCGFTLFLSLILNRTYVLILDILRLEEEVRMSRKTGNKGMEDYEKLKEQLKQKEKDLQAMKSQSEGLQREYNNLGDQVAGRDGTPKKSK